MVGENGIGKKTATQNADKENFNCGYSSSLVCLKSLKSHTQEKQLLKRQLSIVRSPFCSETDRSHDASTSFNSLVFSAWTTRARTCKEGGACCMFRMNFSTTSLAQLTVTPCTKVKNYQLQVVTVLCLNRQTAYGKMLAHPCPPRLPRVLQNSFAKFCGPSLQKWAAETLPVFHFMTKMVCYGLFSTP